MSDWSHDLDHDDTNELDGSGGAGGDLEPGTAFGIDLVETAKDLTAQALQRRVHEVLAEAITAAVNDALNPDVLANLRARAAAAARDSAAADLGALDETPQVLVFPTVVEFVRDYLRLVYRRRIDARTRVWAGRWWDHPEAVIRLEGLWRSWEAARLDPANGMAAWWRDMADHHMNVLMSPDGPFATATDDAEDTNTRGGPLPHVEPPPGMFVAQA